MLRLFVLLSLSAATAFSQATTATIQGVVYDPTGAIVPAAITVTTSRRRWRRDGYPERRHIHRAIPATRRVCGDGGEAGLQTRSAKGHHARRGRYHSYRDDARSRAATDTVTATAEAPLVKVDTANWDR